MKCQWGCPVCSGKITYREGPKQFTQGKIYCEECFEPVTNHKGGFDEYTECCDGDVIGASEARRQYRERNAESGRS